MSQLSRVRRWIARRSGVSRLGVVLLGAFAAEPVRASDSTNQCLVAYSAGQRLRHEGDLVGAMAELRTCGGPACPVRMQGDCQRWLDDVDRALPAVVFRVRDAEGELLANVSASIDGAPPRRLDGRALPMNPGEHVVRFERAGYRALNTPVFVTEGEKLEPRDVMLEPLVGLDESAHPLPTEPRDAVPLSSGPALDAGRTLSPWPIALGAVGLVGGVGFVYFGVRAKNGETDLEQCSPDCRQAQVDDVKQNFSLSNISLGIGLAGLAGAGFLLLLDEPASDGASLTPRHAVRLGSTTTWVTRF
jgi:hypothetical protein